MNLTNGQFEQPTSFPTITRTMMTPNSKNIKINLIFQVNRKLEEMICLQKRVQKPQVYHQPKRAGKKYYKIG